MVHITEKQVIACAQRLNLSSTPDAVQLQKVADELETTYGWVSAIWDSCKIGRKLKSKRKRGEPPITERQKEN